MAEKISNTPWSNFKPSDYSNEQWARACLISTSSTKNKVTCKLPVREPDGTLNRNGMAAAAAALSGARTNLIASNAQKAAAAKTLSGLYKANGLTPPDSLAHDAVDNFLQAYGLSDLRDSLEHHGIKGQKWGVRRGRYAGSGGRPPSSGSKKSSSKKATAKSSKASHRLLSRITKKKVDPNAKVQVVGKTKLVGGSHVSHETAKRMAKMKEGTVITLQSKGGTAKTMIKKHDGTWEETHLSADAERFIRTREKKGHEMSDQELKSALNRARMVKEYDTVFGNADSNAVLRTKVESLQLQKQYSQLQAELHPSAVKRVSDFVSTASGAYESYNKLNKATGGALNATLSEALGLRPSRATGLKTVGKHRG